MAAAAGLYSSRPVQQQARTAAGLYSAQLQCMMVLSWQTCEGAELADLRGSVCSFDCCYRVLTLPKQCLHDGACLIVGKWTGCLVELVLRCVLAGLKGISL